VKERYRNRIELLQGTLGQPEPGDEIDPP